MEVDINLIKESICEYTEEMYAICISYMKKNNIDYKLTGNDVLTNMLKELEVLKDKVILCNNYDEIIVLKIKIETLSKEIRGIIWN